MVENRRETWITGVGIVSSLGEGPDVHWQRLNNAAPNVDPETFAPYIVHPLAPVDFDRQIPKKGDQRQMEPWQRIGTYAAGLALESAGAKGNVALLARMDMIVAASGGERDFAADGLILTGLSKAEKRDLFLNERLMSDLRPTLFLAQLSNLLAGNISIVHGVTGSSRTFMGEESAGVDAIRIALARIAARQSDITLVGGAHNGERRDMLMLYDFGGYVLKDEFRPLWGRSAKGGFASGSLGAFLVLEGDDHARARGAKPIARISAVASKRSDRRPGAITAALREMWQEIIAGRLDSAHAACISGATGAEPATSEERAFLSDHPELAVRATGTHIGHGPEPQFVMNVAIAALAVSKGHLFPACDDSGFERAMQEPLAQAVVTGVGHWRGEGIGLVEAVH
jgi:3-oxoacyl-[acyl-carrier-protein] synthase II